MQNEKAFQKQAAVFANSKRSLVKKANTGNRYYKRVGLGKVHFIWTWVGFKIPKEASEGSYIDKKCPFTGNVSIRGRILK